MNEVNDFLLACDKQRQLLGKMRMLWAYHKLHEVDDPQNNPGAKEWRAASVDAGENVALQMRVLAKSAVDAVRQANYDPAMLFELVESAGSWERFNEAMRKNIPSIKAAAAMSEHRQPQEPDGDGNQQAIRWWNEGDSWAAVNEKMGREKSQAKATEMELKRFAKKNEIEIRKGNPGAKKQH